jgi:transposase-like protein
MTGAPVVAECNRAEASVAKVAIAHSINANVVHRWQQLAREGNGRAPDTAGEFIALPLALPTLSAVHAMKPADACREEKPLRRLRHLLGSHDRFQRVREDLYGDRIAIKLSLYDIYYSDLAGTLMVTSFHATGAER